jgi:hypothetical protein
MHFATVGDQLVVYNPINNELMRLSDTKIETQKIILEPGPIVGVGNKLLAMGSPSALWFDGEIVWPSHSRISAIAVSDIFQIVVFAVYDRWIGVVSMPQWRGVRKASLDGEIGTKILITDSMGMILVLTNHHFFLFTVNGVPIRKVVNNVAIGIWTKFVSNAGFDYVITVDAHNNIVWCEAQHPERRKIIFHFPDLAFLYYKKSIQSIVVLSIHGKVKIHWFSTEIEPTIISQES